MIIDLTVMPQGKTYEDQYQGFMKIFERIANVPPHEKVIVRAPPWSWVPLLKHLNCDLHPPVKFFKHCSTVRGAYEETELPQIDRTILEVLCGFRPETADALWKCDAQWKPKRVRTYEPEKSFIVTTNGSFYRPEVRDFVVALRGYQPTKKKVLLVPCAADKPYPAPVHQMCLDLLPDDWYIANVTGVLGLIPQDLWPIMPRYDSGIPNRWRVFETLRWYFREHTHTRVVVYCDFYIQAVARAFESIEQVADYVLPIQFYYDYEDLMRPDYVAELKRTIRGV